MARKSKKQKTDTEILQKSDSEGSGSEVEELISGIAGNSDEEISFPRGREYDGSDDDTSDKKFEKALFVDADEFNISNIQRKSKEKKNSKKRKRDGDQADILTTKNTSVIYPLKFKTLVTGMNILGAVKEIHEMELVISLPNNLTGVVPITSISEEITQSLKKAVDDDDDTSMETLLPQLSKMFYEGQLICCRIIKLVSSTDSKDKRKHIELSIMPSQVNAAFDGDSIDRGMVISASVANIEDHGYIMNTGIENKNFFMKFYCARENLNVGQVVSCVALSDSKSRVVNLSMNATDFENNTVKSNSVTDRSILRPGFLVDGKITGIDSSGLWIKFCDVFDGAVDWSNAFNIKSHEKVIDLSKIYKEGQKVKARVLYVYPDDEQNVHTNSKQRVGLTLLPHLKSWSPVKYSQSNLQIGSIIESAEVLDSNSKMELVMSLNGDFPVLGHVHISRISDKHIASIDSKSRYKTGTFHKARVISLGHLDGSVQLSLQKSILEAPFLRYDDLSIGDLIEDAEITKVDSDHGTLSVSLSKAVDIRAFCPKTHLTDLPTLKHPEKRFKVGSKIKVRVLSVDPEFKKVAVTHKKSLVNSQLPLITSSKCAKNLLAESKNTEIWAHGVVTGIKDYGLLVTFFGFTKGLVHISLIPKTSSNESPLKYYQIGQLLKCRLVRVDEQDKLRLSLLPASGTYSDKNSMQQYNDVSQVGEKILSLSDVQVGMKTKVLVKSIKSLQANVILKEADKNQNPPFPQVVGRIHISELFDQVNLNESKYGKELFNARGIKTGTTIEVKIIGFHDAKTHRWLPISHPRGSRSIVECSVKPAQLESKELLPNSVIEDIQENQKLTAFISGVDNLEGKYGLWSYISPTVKAKIPFLEISNHIEILNDVEDNYSLGMPIQIQVVSIEEEKNMVVASIKSIQDGYLMKSFESFQASKVLCGKVVRCSEETGLIVQISQLGDGFAGRVALTDISDEYSANPLQDYEKGMLLQCCIVNVDRQNKRLDLSTRYSRICPGKDIKIKDKEINAFDDVDSGDVIRGYVKNIAKNGLFVSLGRQVVGRVKISELFDSYIKDWQSKFTIGQLVEAVILSNDDGKLELSLKLSKVDPERYRDTVIKNGITLEELEVGALAVGTVSRVEKYGVFVELDNSDSGKGKSLRGLCHHSELSEDSECVPDQLYSVGDRVKAIILAVDTEKRQISLGMKPSYFAESKENEIVTDQDDFENMSVEDNLEIGNDNNDGNEDDQYSETDVLFESDELSASDDEFDSNLTNNESDSTTDDKPKKFNWQGNWEPEEEDLDHMPRAQTSGSEIQESTDSQKLSKRQKSKLKKEKAINQAKNESNSETSPETPEDFKRLLMASPNSSYIWIQFMAYYLNFGELEKSRETAERALSVINYREVKEKHNIWMAYLNLENKFGSNDSLKQVFSRAITMNEPKHMYLALANIYEKSDKMDKAVELYEEMVKKFKTSCKVWVQYGLYYFHQKELKIARECLQRSLKVLPRRKHLKITLKFARFEFKFGDPEVGRTIFEGLISNNPKRTDIWSVYIDLEVSLEEIQNGRRLYERATNLNLSSKKMKFLFKRYLDFEKKNGDESTVEHVVQAARNYVASLVNSSENKE